MELAKILTERFGQEFKRVPMSGAWGTRNREIEVREDAMQILSGDIMCPENFKFSVESKGRIDFNFWDMLNAETKGLDIDEWILQAKNDAAAVHKEALIYVKVNRRKPFVLYPSKLDEDFRNRPETRKLFGKVIEYQGMRVLRFDYFLELPNEFFFEV